MLNAQSIESAEELERVCTLAGFSPLIPEKVRRSLADAHWILDSSDGIQARCSLWWNNVPHIPEQRVGVLGHYTARDTDAARFLLQLACAELARQGCTLVIGPMDGSTHQRYRLLTERGTEAPFFLEPDNPDDWPEHFTSSGFTPLASYYSALQTGLDQPDPRLPALTARLTAAGITLRDLKADVFEDELERIYEVVNASFRDTFLASPISKEDFLAGNKLLQPYIRPELVLLAEREGATIGFVFAIPDWLQAQRGVPIDTVIIKTLAVHPAHRRGLGTLLVGRLIEIASTLGYTRAIHALMYEHNVSRRISQRYHGQIMRRYTLYARRLETQP